MKPSPHFGRVLAAYGGIFVAGSLAWGMILDGFRPDRWDITGALICLLGVAVIMYVAQIRRLNPSMVPKPRRVALNRRNVATWLKSGELLGLTPDALFSCLGPHRRPIGPV